MLKTKRLLSNAELDIFIRLREEDNSKAAKYIKSLQKELFEEVDYDVTRQRPRGFEVTED